LLGVRLFSLFLEFFLQYYSNLIDSDLYVNAHFLHLCENRAAVIMHGVNRIFVGFFCLIFITPCGSIQEKYTFFSLGSFILVYFFRACQLLLSVESTSREPVMHRVA
jgi:hypothetical protein